MIDIRGREIDLIVPLNLIDKKVGMKIDLIKEKAHQILLSLLNLMIIKGETKIKIFKQNLSLSFQIVSLKLKRLKTIILKALKMIKMNRTMNKKK
jgi:predicted transcriptional regulator